MEHIQLAERISLALQRLERAILTWDRDEVTQLRSELQSAGATSLTTPLRLAMPLSGSPKASFDDLLTMDHELGLAASLGMNARVAGSAALHFSLREVPERHV